MKNHFDLTIKYHEDNMEVHLQCLSCELPKIMYFVSPKDEKLRKIFENFNLFFIQESVNSDSGKRTIVYSVNYDYKSKNFNKYRDIEFETAVWKELILLETLCCD